MGPMCHAFSTTAVSIEPSLSDYRCIPGGLQLPYVNKEHTMSTGSQIYLFRDTWQRKQSGFGWDELMLVSMTTFVSKCL